ncbi:MAG: GntR family transcriptional regulator [Caldilineaceae bacterium]|nr:GntR family transcriptional regulator [Caldilineaceae bacterium]
MAWLQNSRFKPGDRLKEEELAEELRVSRTPVREAFKTLAAHGFITKVARKGVLVSEINPRELQEVMDLRYLLEMHAAERGVERITDAEIGAMRSLVEQCDALVTAQDVQAYIQYVKQDCDLHRLIILAARNRLLAEIYERLAVFLQIARVRLSQTGPDMTRGHEEHRRIVAAYAQRDKDQLLELLGNHLNRSRKEILQVVASMGS